MKKTLVLGASPNPARVSFEAVRILRDKGHLPVPVSIRHGNIEGIRLQQGKPEIDEIHTVTLYLNADNQREYYDYLLALKPKRIIFNPGSENPEFMLLARKHGIEVEIACTLVMLSIGAY